MYVLYTCNDREGIGRDGKGEGAFDGEMGEGVGCIVQVHTYGGRNLGGNLVVDDAAASMIVHSGHGDNTSISAFFIHTKFELQRCTVFHSTEYVRI